MGRMQVTHGSYPIMDRVGQEKYLPPAGEIVCIRKNGRSPGVPGTNCIRVVMDFT